MMSMIASCKQPPERGGKGGGGEGGARGGMEERGEKRMGRRWDRPDPERRQRENPCHENAHRIEKD